MPQSASQHTTCCHGEASHGIELGPQLVLITAEALLALRPNRHGSRPLSITEMACPATWATRVVITYILLTFRFFGQD